MRIGHIKREETVATVHGDDITIGGERSAVEFLIKTISRKYEIKKQVIGRDPDLEKSGRIFNRVIEWNRDGITRPETRQVDTQKASNWNMRITLRLHVLWTGRMRTAHEMM